MICVRETIRCISAEDPPSSSFFFKKIGRVEEKKWNVGGLVLVVGFEKTERAGWIACVLYATGDCSV
jgi:hypothetical protein